MSKLAHVLQVDEEVLDLRSHLRLQDGGWNLADEVPRIDSRENEGTVGENPPDVLRVAVRRPLHLAATPVDIQPGSPERDQRREV